MLETSHTQAAQVKRQQEQDTARLQELHDKMQALLAEYGGRFDVVHSCDDDGEGHTVELFLQVGAQFMEF